MIVTEHGVGPHERHVHEHAAQLAIDRTAAWLAATQPPWLTDLLGPRPTDRPAATQVWDDAIRELAGHRARHGLLDPGVATGTRATTPVAAVWQRARDVVEQARTWLATHTAGPDLSVTRTRAATELAARRRGLDALFATAPPDQARFIEQLRTSPTLALNQVELLQHALDVRGERRQWILQNWAHIIEYAQILATTQAGWPGPEIQALLQTLTHSHDPHLAAAARNHERWFTNLTAQLVRPDAASLDPDVENLLTRMNERRSPQRSTSRWRSIGTIAASSSRVLTAGRRHQRTCTRESHSEPGLGAPISMRDQPALAATSAGRPPETHTAPDTTTWPPPARCSFRHNGARPRINNNDLQDHRRLQPAIDALGTLAGHRTHPR